MKWNLRIFLVVLGAALMTHADGSRADDPPAPASKAQAKTRAAAGRSRPAEGPPVCPNHRRNEPMAARTARNGRMPNGFGPMPRVFDDMMQSLARNPAGGFQDFLDTQQRRAVQTIRLTPAEERQIGRAWRDRYLLEAAQRGYRRVDDPEKLRYLRDLVNVFARQMNQRARYPEIDVILIDAPMADGQAFPGGTLAFTTALLDEPDEATVAGVVAHELAHLDLGHLYDYARRSKLTDSGFQPPGPGVDFDAAMSRMAAVGSLMMNPFRPEDELEADCLSATWLYREGYDPRALVRFFDRLHARTQDQPDHPFFRFARSHPHSLARGAEVLERLGQLRRWRNRDDLGLYPENLRRLETRARERGELRPN